MAAVLLCLAWSTPVSAQQRLRPEIEAAIHLKALIYDRAIRTRNSKRFNLVVVYDKASPRSKSTAEAIVGAMRKQASLVKLQGLPVSVQLLGYDQKTLATDLETANASAVYLSYGLEAEAEQIRLIAIQKTLPILCGERSLVKRGIAALGAYVDGDTPGLAVNLRTARATGMDLDSDLFSVAEVFR